jgi:glycosidase
VQKEDANSLWNYYKNLFKIRKEFQAFRLGDYQAFETENKNVLGFKRTFENESVFVLINLSEAKQEIKEVEVSEWKPAFNYQSSTKDDTIYLDAFGTLILTD